MVAVCRTVGEAIAASPTAHTVVVKSTVVPGTTDGIVTSTIEAASGRRVGEGLGIGMNPEFLTEGRAVADFLSPDRLVLGANDSGTHEVLSELYRRVDPQVPRLRTNTRTAEMIKYASNALLATSISFANEIADLCTAVGDVDIVDVMFGVHTSDYLSPRSEDGRIEAPIAAFLEAGCGFGGSCLPKDLRALIAEGERRGVALPLLRGVLATNESRTPGLLALLESAAGSIRGLRVALLGIAFKPDTDDVRESPAIPIAEALVDAGAVVTAHDPVVRSVPEPLRVLGIGLEPNLAAALNGAEAIVLVTSWDDYRELPRLLQGRQPGPIVLDGRRVLEPSSIERYVGVGRG
jgi:UDPglucose 6-dehydrogenase/GDP-mannose 6-dehydrogenase